MNYTIPYESLIDSNIDDYFKRCGLNEDYIYKNPGEEHFRLLSYLSTLINNTTIIDIGTHHGHAAVALAYNHSNTVYTFDRVNTVDPPYLRTPNIRFVQDDLYANPEKWESTLLMAAFIFIDTEPHNGNNEYEFIQYLKSIDYKGFIVCDDIWYFKSMRDNLWYKIEDRYKYDLTLVGHWSGTGIITFNDDIKFEKRDNSNWTLVTAYFNLTKCSDASDEINKRDETHYLYHSISTLSLPYNLVIYCDQDTLPKIQKIRPEFLKDKTEYIVCNFEEFQFVKNGKKQNENFSDYRKKIAENRTNHPYYFDNRNTASYYLFCMSRYIMLKDVITRNPFGSTHFSWINFCIERMGFKNLICLDEALSIKRDKFSTCYIDYIPESLVKNTPVYFEWGRCSMCSGFFTGNAKYMYEVCDLIENKFLEYLDMGYGHADEQLYSPVYFQNPDLFEHYYGDYTEMISNYVYVYDRPEPPIYNFIQNSYDNSNYIKCYEACKFVFNSWALGKCNIDNDYLQRLFHYYMNCKRILKDL